MLDGECFVSVLDGECMCVCWIVSVFVWVGW
jgi:hypothetical protein